MYFISNRKSILVTQNEIYLISTYKLTKTLLDQKWVHILQWKARRLVDLKEEVLPFSEMKKTS